MAAAGIVNTLKTKIKENAEELEKYEILAEENRKKFDAEKKVREETEAEVSALQRKIKLLEDSVERSNDRLEVITRNLHNANESLETSDGGRYIDDITTVKIHEQILCELFMFCDHMLMKTKSFRYKSNCKNKTNTLVYLTKKRDIFNLHIKRLHRRVQY